MHLAGHSRRIEPRGHEHCADVARSKHAYGFIDHESTIFIVVQKTIRRRCGRHTTQWASLPTSRQAPRVSRARGLRRPGDSVERRSCRYSDPISKRGGWRPVNSVRPLTVGEATRVTRITSIMISAACRCHAGARGTQLRERAHVSRDSISYEQGIGSCLAKN